MAEDINYILDALKFDAISIVGSSFGGLVGLRIFDQKPERIKRLIFVGSMPKFAKSSDFPCGIDLDDAKRNRRKDLLLQCLNPGRILRTLP